MSAPTKRTAGRSRARPAAGRAPQAAPAADFEFAHNGETFRLPSLTTVKAGVIRRIRNIQDQADAFFVLLEAISGAEALAALDDMDMAEFANTMADWQKQGQVTLGELLRSSS